MGDQVEPGREFIEKECAVGDDLDVDAVLWPLERQDSDNRDSSTGQIYRVAQPSGTRPASS